MRRGFTSQLEQLLRRVDATAGIRTLVQSVSRNADGSLRQHVRQRRDQWGEADGVTAGPPPTHASFDFLPEGDVRLKDTIQTIVSHGSSNNHFTPLDRLSPHNVVNVVWADALKTDFELLRLQLYLNPVVNAGARREVVRWRCELLYAATARIPDFASSSPIYTLAPLCQPIDVDVLSDAAGPVLFDFSTLSDRPRPKMVQTRVIGDEVGSGLAISLRGSTVILVTALKENGETAGNAGLAYDSGTASVTTLGTTLRSRRLSKAGAFDHELVDEGTAGGAPRAVIETGSYTTATLAFTSDLFDLGSAPAGDVQLVLRGSVPLGCALVGEVRNDADSGWVAFTDGQWMSGDLGLTPTQTRKMRVTLTTDSSASLTPTLTGLGFEEITEHDLSELSRVDGGNWAIDPVTLRGEIPEVRVTVIHNPPRDHRDWITDLLAENHIGDMRVRLFWGALSLPRHRWMHVDDFLIDGVQTDAASVTLRCISVLCLLRDMVPRYEPGEVVAPNADAVVGAWTTDAGGTTNLYQRLDEPGFDDTDYVRSPASPSDDACELHLATPADPVGRKHTIEYRYRKDQDAGEQIDLTVELCQGVEVLASLTHPDIPAEPLAAGVLDASPASWSLSAEQVQSITDYTDLRLRFTANAPSPGTGRRALVTWARLKLGGKHEAVNYHDESLKAVYDDLLQSRLAVDGRYQGPGVEDATTLVSKDLTVASRQGKPVGKHEIDAIAHLAGGGIISSQGRIAFRALYGTHAVRAVFPSAETRMQASPGYEERVPEYFVPWRWNAEKGDFDDQAYVASSGALLRLGQARLQPPAVLDAEIAKWISAENLDLNGRTLADRIGIRHVEALGTGLILWQFTSTHPYPELEPGDLVAVETDHFIARDPNVARALRGAVWAVGVVQSVDVKARHFAVWIRNYADLVAGGESVERRFTIEIVAGGVERTWRAGKLLLSWLGTPGVLSVKIATSTTAFPAAGTGTVYVGQQGTETLAPTFAYDDTIYVTITPYGTADASGLEGLPYQFRTKLPVREDQFDTTTGRRKRAALFDDGKYALKASDTAGKESDDDLFLASSKTVKVGTVASPGSLTKTLRIPHTELLPESSAQSWFVTNGFTRPNTANVVVVLRGAVVLPKGVTITSVASRMYRQSSSNDSAACAVVRINDDGTTTGLATINHSGTGWNTNSQGVSQLVGDEAYSIEVQLLGQASVSDARFMWVEITYTMPSYDKGI